MDMDDLMEIETKLAYQEKAIKDLNDVICDQQKQIDRLAAICNRLEKQNDAYAQLISKDDAPANEKPPHY